MPVNLNPPPLPTPESVRAPSAAHDAEAEAPADDAFAQLLVASEAAVSGADPGRRAEAENGCDETAPTESPGNCDAAVPLPGWAEWALQRTSAAAERRPPTEQNARAMPLAREEKASAPPLAVASLSVHPSLQDVRSASAAPALSAADPAAADPAAMALDAFARTGAAMPADEAAERARAAQPGAAQSGAARAAAHILQRLHDRGTAQAELERDPAAARIAPDATQRPDPAPAWQEPSRIDATVRADVRSEAEVRNAGRGEVPRAPAANATEAVASGMLAGTLATPVSPTAHSPTVITVHTSIGAAGWERELSDKLARVVLRHDRIEIRVAPAELGPVEIRVDLGAGPASLAIVASHAATRDALEQALPQLREALAAQGIALGDATVRDGHAGADAHAQHARPHPRSVPNLLAGGLAPATTVLAPRRPDRLVDTFA